MQAIAPSYMTRVLRLTLLVPEIVEAIMDAQKGPDVTLVKLMNGFPVERKRQHLDTLRARDY